jgi:hypothetical protein
MLLIGATRTSDSGRLRVARRIAMIRDLDMKWVFGMALALACLVAAGPGFCAQQQEGGMNAGSGQNPPAANAPNPAPAGQPTPVNTQNNQNPFPEDTDSVPVMPNRNSPGIVPGLTDEGGPSIPMPAADMDPVRSPESAAAAEFQNEKDSSSSLAGLGNLLPAPDDDTQPTKRNKNGQAIVPEHHETAKEDEDVGNYYLDNHDWKGALSRFESALVLDPDNPDVYWGLAESQRHLGNFADARANYMKVMEYDPGSRHAKDARKALDDPQIANAKPAAPAAAPAQ